jgi:transposase
MEDQKSKELRKCRCLNPHPEKVTCDLFTKAGFFDPRDLLQVKYEMVRKIKVEKKPIRHAARQFGFSRPSVYKALDSFQKTGVTGLLRTKPGPRRAHKLNDSVIKFIEAQRTQNASLTLSELVNQIKNDLGVVVHRRSIQRVMNREKKRGFEYDE